MEKQHERNGLVFVSGALMGAGQIVLRNMHTGTNIDTHTQHGGYVLILHQPIPIYLLQPTTHKKKMPTTKLE